MCEQCSASYTPCPAEPRIEACRQTLHAGLVMVCGRLWGTLNVPGSVKVCAGHPSSFGVVATAAKWNPGKQTRLRADSTSAQAEPDAFRAMALHAPVAHSNMGSEHEGLNHH